MCTICGLLGIDLPQAEVIRVTERYVQPPRLKYWPQRKPRALSSDQYNLSPTVGLRAQQRRRQQVHRVSMPIATVGIQIGLELTKIFPVRQAINGVAKYTLEQVLSLARSLQSSGSDLLVEEDLAVILGRVWIDAGITRRFKEEILRNTAIVPISNDCALELRKGAGPTLERAFRDQERGYLATVIQLSLLCWTHDRTSLASALSYCLNKRFDLEFPGANPSPGFDGLMSTLDACSSQANAFPWSEYFDVVSQRIRPLYRGIPRHLDICLPSNLLLTCLDSLCIIQRMPEEHVLTVSERRGCITLIVWAHYLLGLSVLLRGSTPAQSILFSHNLDPSPNVIIDGTSILTASGPEICLLDKRKEVQLRIDPLLAEFVPMEARERLHLRGYGSVKMCRVFDEPPSFKGSPEFHDGVEYAVAMAVMISRRVARVLDVEKKVALIPCSIKIWQIFAAAAVLFPEVSLDESVVIKYADEIPPEQRLLDIQNSSLPCALRNYLVAKERIPVARTLIGRIAVDVVVMATVADVDSCGRIPLIAEGMGSTLLHDKLLGSKGPVQLAPNDLFSHFCWCLAGPDLHSAGMAIEQDSTDIFMVSDFGWTVCLPSYGDNDPATVNPEKLYIREGVPTDKKTLERKSRVRDAILSQVETIDCRYTMASVPNWILDVGVPTYKPRCVSPVTERSEFYGARNDGFHLIVQFKGTHLEPSIGKLVGPATFETRHSYRAFHDNLWGVFRSPPCEHPSTQPGTSAKLAVDVATAAGNWSWYSGETSTKGKTGISERIVVVLVRGDARARWLAVGVASVAKSARRTMLRGSNCCEDCAVEAAAKLPDKWFVII